LNESQLVEREQTTLNNKAICYIKNMKTLMQLVKGLALLFGFCADTDYFIWLSILWLNY
jgi:hypothetical protein